MSYSNNDSKYYVRSIQVHGVPVEVEFRYSQGYAATADEPESPVEVDVEAVFIEGFDIGALCGDETIKLIEDILLKMFDEREEEV